MAVLEYAKEIHKQLQLSDVLPDLGNDNDGRPVRMRISTHRPPRHLIHPSYTSRA